jgi:hypothetical protein
LYTTEEEGKGLEIYNAKTKQSLIKSSQQAARRYNETSLNPECGTQMREGMKTTTHQIPLDEPF